MRAVRWSAGAAFALVAVVVAVSLGASRGRSLQVGRTAYRLLRVDSGIAGSVVIGPTCPVERPGRTCERPYRTTIAIRRQRTHTLIARVQSSAQGRFRIALAPGMYLVLPQNGRPYPRSSPQVARVHRHRYAQVVISYDSGIR
jgi:hypothetical protein